MPPITIDTKKPAPKTWRKFENAMLIMLIPAGIAILQGWGFKDVALANKLMLLISTGLTAIIKAVGYFIANGEEYVLVDKKSDNEKTE